MPNARRSGFELDKDLKVLGNKIYGPKFCTWVPKAINCMLTGTTRKDAGIFKDSRGYQVLITANGKTNHILWTKDKNKAKRAYLKAKLGFILQAASKFKNKLDSKVLENLTNRPLMLSYLKGEL